MLLKLDLINFDTGEYDTIFKWIISTLALDR
jgi:hypothetical protein